MKSRRHFVLWTALLAFALFSTAAGLRLLLEADLWTLRASQSWASSTLDRLGAVFSTIGGLEVSVPAFAALVIWLFLTDRRTLAIRLVVALLVTSLVEFAMKMWLPQAQMPEDAARTTDFSPIVDVHYAHPYPSGHMLRSVLLLGAIFLLWRNRLARSLVVVAIAGMALSRVYLGVHWSSDVIGGVLLGLIGLFWAFGKQSAVSGQRSAKSQLPIHQQDIG